MGISSRRSMRSIFSRKKQFSHMKMRGDDVSVQNKESTTEPVSVLSYFECAEGLDTSKSHNNIIIVSNTDSGSSHEEEKVSEADILCSKDLTIELARDTSLMTELVAQRMASRSFEIDIFSEGDEARDAGEETTDDNGEASIPETACHPILAQDAWKCGNNLVETSQILANDFFEGSIMSGRQLMESAEQSSQSVIEKRLPLSPLLEQTSERVETAFIATMEEVNEFFVDHWTMLQRFMEARKPSTAGSSIANVRAENPSPNVAVEVQIKAAAE